MTKENNIHQTKHRRQRNHPLSMRLIAGLLCICLSVMSLPAGTSGTLALAAQKREIVAFPALPAQIRNQMAKTGTKLEELELPDTLMAVCRSAGEEYQGLKQIMKGLSAEVRPQKATFVKAGNTLSEEEAEASGNAQPVTAPSDGEQDPAQVTEPPKEPDPSEGEAGNPEETDPSEGEAGEPEETDPSEGESDPPGVTDPPKEEPEPGIEQGQTELVTIGEITWSSEPEYDSDTEGIYQFTPVLPEGYQLAEGGRLPEITVEVVRSGKTEAKDGEDEGEENKRSTGETEELVAEQNQVFAVPSVPGCGVISQDTVWTGDGILENGELIVNPGVTLTINGALTIQGNVKIQGGGTIVRGSGSARFVVNRGNDLTISGVTLEGAALSSKYSMIEAVGSNIVLDDGCIFSNFKKDGISAPSISSGHGCGGLLFIEFGSAVFNDITVENCSAPCYGGAVFSRNSTVTINGGIYRNNQTVGGFDLTQYGAGFLYNAQSKLYINGGTFIGNKSVGRAGCIFTIGYEGTEVCLRGGKFQGNTSSYPGHQGSGGIFYLAQGTLNLGSEKSILDFSGNVQFCGDGTHGSGTDGIYLELGNRIARKIQVSNPLSYPMDIFLTATEGYVIAEGYQGYVMQERDMKKISFHDVGNSGQKWYAVLDKGKNQIYLSKTNPQYGYYVYYISNGAEGTVADDNRYSAGDMAVIKSGTGLKFESGVFHEWNTESDGTGKSYHEGDTLEIQEDINLYAISRNNEMRTFSANFYSGGAGQKETQSVEIDAASSSGTVNAPELKAMEGWTPLGWNAAKDGYTGEIAPGDELTLTEDRDYYGTYQKPVRLTYEAEDAQSVPESVTRHCGANVHEEVSVAPAQFTVAEGAERPGCVFAGWNTKADGTGRTYKGGEALESETDVTLYAMFRKTLRANFYSGDAGQKETKSVEVEASVGSGTVNAPDLKAMEGWIPLGWNAAKDQYTGEIAPGDEITLTEDKDYYGTYQKAVNLTYVANGAQTVPEAESGQCHANVHEEIAIRPVEFTIAPPAVRLGYSFAGWNTKADGTGKAYKEGDVLETETDITLYAIFKKPLHAIFYSGSAGQNEMVVVEIPEDAVSGTIRAPLLKELQLESGEENPEESKEAAALKASDSGASQDWKPLGWNVDQDGYTAEIEPGEDITLTDDSSYYGVYGKEVTLTYEAKGMEGFPYSESGECYGNVHEKFTKFLAEFVIGPGPDRPGSAFVGWNTKIDGTGESYQEGEILRTEEDITLYAVYQKTLTADFYSGSAGRKETKAVSISGMETSGMVTAPELVQMEGWNPVGWVLEKDSYSGEIQQKQEIALTQDMAYYGVYEKSVTLSYEGQGEGETLPGHANVHEQITYDWPVFTLAPAPERQGYHFAGWNEKEDGTGKSYPADSRQVLEKDTVLYATWAAADDTPYLVEHYKQDAEGDGYILEEADTEELAGATDSVVNANAKKYAGFTENTRHEQRCGSGKVEADGSLILRLFYDRDIYQVSFDLNGGMGRAPKKQTVRYGCPVEEVEDPVKRGYSFKGWYLDSAGTPECQWDFGGNVEENTSSLDVTLYAKWVDDIAPVLEKAAFRKGHTDLASWMIGQKGLAITVPIIEEGSGAERAVYALMPEGKEEKPKSAQAWQKIYAKAYGGNGLPLGLAAAGGAKTGKAKIRERDGETVAEFTIDEDFKGTIAMTCTDRAGNVSARKVLTSKGQGVIVEDNAPRIRFTAKGKAQAGGSAVIEVEVEDDAGDNISGGIAGITYRIDKGKEKEVKEKAFSKRIVESYRFTVEIKGEGSHTLYVEAKDNAGNWNDHKMTLAIPEKGEPAALAETKSPGPEPKTGDIAHVEIYATVSMIAGFTYLLMYFTTKEHGMTEQKKDELVSRLVCWAKEKGGIKRMLALAAIFLLLAYYHSIGKKVSAEWRKACER